MRPPRWGLDATYSVGQHLSGVGVYSRELLYGLAAAQPEAQFRWYYRPHRFTKSLSEGKPRNVRRRLLLDGPWPGGVELFHGLNQRLPQLRFRRTVCTFHDLFVMTSAYATPEFRERFTRQARDAAARADLIIAVSTFTAGQIQELGLAPASRLRVVLHGVHLPPAEEIVPLTEREPWILHVGAVQERKNIGRLLEAFEHLPKCWRLLLAGSDGYGAAGIRERIEQSPRREHIQLLGWVPDHQVRDLYRRSRMLAFPSLNEGFGIPVLEAMAWGTPVLTSNRSALPEAGGGAALLIDPESVEEITAGLTELGANSPSLRERIQRGRDHAAQCSWSAAAQKTWQVYQELLR